MTNKIGYKKIFIRSLLILILLFTAIKPNQSIAVGINGYYGGRVITTLYCTCDSGKMMSIVQDFSSGRILKLGFMLSDLSRIFYMNKNPFVSGNYLLGSYTKIPSVCMMGVPPTCYPVRLDGTLNSNPGTGTS